MKSDIDYAGLFGRGYIDGYLPDPNCNALTLAVREVFYSKTPPDIEKPKRGTCLKRGCPCTTETLAHVFCKRHIVQLGYELNDSAGREGRVLEMRNKLMREIKS